MRTHRPFVAMLAALAISGLASCDQTADAPPVRSIRATITTTSGAPVPWAVVKLYDTQTSWQSNGGADATVTADGGGVALFPSVKEGSRWYIKTTGPCHNSVGATDYFDITGTFTGDHTIDVSVVCREMGSLRLHSTEVDPYIIEIDGAYAGVVQAYESLTISGMATGTHGVKATQQSGYWLYPTIYTFNSTVSYCSENTVNF